MISRQELGDLSNLFEAYRRKLKTCKPKYRNKWARKIHELKLVAEQLYKASSELAAKLKAEISE